MNVMSNLFFHFSLSIPSVSLSLPSLSLSLSFPSLSLPSPFLSLSLFPLSTFSLPSLPFLSFLSLPNPTLPFLSHLPLPQYLCSYLPYHFSPSLSLPLLPTLPYTLPTPSHTFPHTHRSAPRIFSTWQTVKCIGRSVVTICVSKLLAMPRPRGRRPR